MQLNTVIDDHLMQQAKQIAGLQNEREIIEMALKFWLTAKQRKATELVDMEAVFANFIGCAQGDPLLSEQYKDRLTDSLKCKYDYR